MRRMPVAVMSEPLLADDGYPSEEELNRISGWDWRDIPGWLDYVRERWRWAEQGYWDQGPATLTMHTGGWSGNEDLVQAMRQNYALWALLWESARRGGHYVLDLTRIPKGAG